MGWRIITDGKRAIGFFTHDSDAAEQSQEENCTGEQQDDACCLECDTPECQECQTTEYFDLDAEHPLVVNIVPEQTNVTPADAIDAMENLCIVMHRVSAELGIPFREVMKGVERVERNKRRTARGKRRERNIWEGLLT